MDSKFTPNLVESDIYASWEAGGLLKPTSGTPFTILMPPPNANASLHAGHGMYVIDDIVTRYKRLCGYASLWIPGADHAGFETQYVYEKHLAKQGKSRMDFDRTTLYNNIYTFVKENSGLIFEQFKRLGFLADWERSVFTLDTHVIAQVFETFKKMEGEGKVYRDSYMVNYCTHCGTSLAELEVEHIERIDPLYYLKYGPFVLATVRPETKFGDTAVAVNPKDKRYQNWVGKEVEVKGLLGAFKLTVVADDFVDPKFGTGVVKVTPAHDPNDFEMGRRHGLEVKQVIDLNGRLNKYAGQYAGLKVKAAREKIVTDLVSAGFIEKIDEQYTHAVGVCYKCKHDLEPMVMPNWFIRVAELKHAVIDVVKKDEVKFHPKKYKKQMLQWLDIMHDWPISRQVVWGIRIPVWYEINEASKKDIWVTWIDTAHTPHQGSVGEFLQKGIHLEEITAGLQKVTVPSGVKQPSYVVSMEKPVGDYLPETDTFDTWFSSGQWPLVTLHEGEYKDRFPTDFMGTLSDILKFWVSRMIMFSLYLRREVPFKDVYLWSMVADAKGTKMSKSKGNVVNPIELIQKYGADAFRAALIFGNSEGGTVNLADDKVIGMRNFTNKIWNIGRFIYLLKNEERKEVPVTAANSTTIKALTKEGSVLMKQYIKYMDGYKFAYAFELVYHFLWHRFADYYIEQLKESAKNGNIEALTALERVYCDCLRMIHPFMPFVTDAVWKQFYGNKRSILNEKLL